MQFAHACLLRKRKYYQKHRKTNGISYKKEVCSDHTGTDAWPIQVSNHGGVRCLLISVPLKYMHTTVETVDVRDIESAAELLAQYDVDGGLIGGASLVAEKFAAIVAAASK